MLTKTTTNRNPRTTNYEQRTTDVLAEAKCEDCVFSVGVKGPSDPILTCRNKAAAPGRLWVVDQDHCCPNFTADKEILAPELVRALAEGAKLIPLTQDQYAIVDPQDYQWLTKYKWCAVKSGRVYYAARRKKGKLIYMHRLIMSAPKNLIVDHIDHNGTNNRRCNLRLCKQRQNTQNRRPWLHGFSKYKGVTWHKKKKRFCAVIWNGSKNLFLGSFTDEIAAAKAYDKKAAELFGEFAYLNFPCCHSRESGNPESSS